jgi:glutamate--cysteine ligase
MSSNGNHRPAAARPAAGVSAFAAEPLSEEDAEAHVHGICFKTGPPARVGVELEWLVSERRDPTLRVQAKRIRQAVASLSNGDAHAILPGGGTLSTEPGGQLEVSSAPATSIGGCIAATSRDLAALRDAAQAADLRLSGYGLDPLRPPRRVLDLPRYAAMEEFFDRRGPWGRQMMCNTASVQVCLDAGDNSAGPAGYRWRWQALHAIGPVLVSAFANSPLRQGRPSGWRSTRQLVWSRLDPGRTRPPPGAEPAGGPAGEGASGDGADPRAAWAAYALDAELMCVRRDGGSGWGAPPGVTFRDWLRGAGERRPTADDLTYHLSTLFPPVRPQGHLELRVIDAQPDDGWVVPAAVAAALLDDPRAAQDAMDAVQPLWHGVAPCTVREERTDANPWLRAARLGPQDPVLDQASRACFTAAGAALSRASVPARIRQAVTAFTERYVLRSRCPADDQLDRLKEYAS